MSEGAKEAQELTKDMVALATKEDENKQKAIDRQLAEMRNLHEKFDLDGSNSEQICLELEYKDYLNLKSFGLVAIFVLRWGPEGLEQIKKGEENFLCELEMILEDKSLECGDFLGMAERDAARGLFVDARAPYKTYFERKMNISSN